jgi:hypothetical protein
MHNHFSSIFFFLNLSIIDRSLMNKTKMQIVKCSDEREIREIFCSKN